ncbi:unnamed protein product [Trichobilharzia szidati]|nr:unnamed protein product [Trichobilharzia szidati]
MATCNTNGLPKHHEDSILSGDSLIPIIQPHNIFDNTIERKINSIMAPRTGPYLASMPIQLNGASNPCKSDDDNDTKMGNATAVIVDQSISTHHQIPVSSSISNSPAVDRKTSSPNVQISQISSSSSTTTVPKRRSVRDKRVTNSENTIQYHASLTQRLNVCDERLLRIRTRALNLLTRLSACHDSSGSQNDGNESLPSSCVPSILSWNLTNEDTESSTDNDDDDDDNEAEMRNKALSSSKQSWLYTRSVTHSNWQWLRSEIESSRMCIQELERLKHHFHNSRKGFKHEEANNNNGNSGSSNSRYSSEEMTCSRVSPYCVNKRKPRHTYHNLSSPKYAHIMQEFNEYSAGDPYIKCSCIPPFIGPCILCCGSELSPSPPPRPSGACSVELSNKSDGRDLLISAHSLCTHIHPKLSIPGDIQLALRLESRLSGYSSVYFRPHKTTVRSIQAYEKPKYLQTLNSIINNNTHISSHFKDNEKPNDESTIIPTKSSVPRSKNSRLKKRKLVSSKKSQINSSSSSSCSLQTSPGLSTKLPRQTQESAQDTNKVTEAQ